MLFNELDLLEMRLEILDEHVDFFVIGQSYETFSGIEKPLYFDLTDARWKKWKHKFITAPIPMLETKDVFERTAFQKDYIRKHLDFHCQSDDVVYYGDVDEIWKPQEEEGKLEQLNYCYYLNMRSSETWQGTNVCRYKNLTNLNELRANHDNVLHDGGWHFTNQGGIEQLRKKIEAYDHQEMISDDVRNKLEERMLNGEDYLGRNHDWKGKRFDFWLDENEWPRFLKENREKYERFIK